MTADAAKTTPPNQRQGNGCRDDARSAISAQLLREICALLQRLGNREGVYAPWRLRSLVR